MIPSSIVDTTITPLYAGVKRVLEQGRFLKDGMCTSLLCIPLLNISPGCTLAFYCTNQYSHTHPQANTKLPHALKGIDATIFNVFSTLGLAVSTRPVLNHQDLRDYPLIHLGTDPESEYDSEGGKAVRRGEMNSFGKSFHELLLTYIDCEKSWRWAISVSIVTVFPPSHP